MKRKTGKSAEELHDEIVEEAIRDSEPEDNSDGRSSHERENRGSTRVILFIAAGFFIMLFVLWALPASFIKIDPEPKSVPKLFDIIPNSLAIPDNASLARPNGQSILSYVSSGDPLVKQAATRIATYGCEANMESAKVCQAKAAYYFVRDNFAYVSETDEYYQLPMEMFYTRGGDCDDFAIMLASMEEAIGVPVRFVEVPSHVYVQVYLDDAHKKYKQEDGWINLDATCKSCAFGDIPGLYKGLPKKIIW